MQTGSPVLEVDRACLTTLVRVAFDRPGLEISNWEVFPLHGGLEWNSAVYRFRGSAREAGETITWSLILKTIQPTPKAMEPGGIWYWKREAMAYQSGLLQDLPGGHVSGPICYELSERQDGSLWLWLEDIEDDMGSSWPLEQYAVAARHLGQFNGAYLVGQPFPNQPWITRNWLRMYVEHAAGMIEFIRANQFHPVVRHLYPGDSIAQILGFWDERSAILDKLDGLPQVFCHMDAFKRNLFARRGKTLAIDWGYMSIAPVGAELAALMAASLSFFEVPCERVKEMDRLCFEGYLQGLRDAGWNGDPKLVRTGYVVSCLLRYPIGGNVGELLPVLLEQEGRARIESAFTDKSADQLEKSDPALVTYFQGLLPEAMKLLGMKILVGVFSHIAWHMLQLRLKKRQ